MVGSSGLAKFAIVATFDIAEGRMDDIKLYEVYEDDAAVQIHLNGPSVARMRAETTEMVAKLTGIRRSQRSLDGRSEHT